MSRRRLWAFAIVVVIGCQAPPAHIACYDLEEGGPPRKGLMIRQILADTAVQTAQYPLRGGAGISTIPIDYARAIALFIRRKCLPISANAGPEPNPPDRALLDPNELQQALH